MRKGILAAGNWIIDQVKIIDDFPPEERLSNIIHEYTSNGGAAYNLLKSLAKMESPFPLAGLGLVGDDPRGQGILEECQDLAIHSNQIKKTAQASTSYTDVMSVQSTGKRTFFHHRGSNALLDESHFGLSESLARIFYLGYLLLLDKLDEKGKDGTTGASRILKQAKELGFMTAADVVSEASDRFQKVIPPALPYIDILFVNEFEAERLTGISVTDQGGSPVPGRCYRAAKEIIRMGVRQWAILHFPQGAIAVSREDQIMQPAIRLSPQVVAGSVGAGDAFAAGVLLGIHEKWDMKACLELGVGAAASSLFSATASDGILSYKECLALGKRWGYQHRIGIE